MDNSLATETWLFEIAILILVAKSIEGLAYRIGIPRVVFFVLLGILIAFVKFFTGYVFSTVLEVFSTIGIVSLLFLAGLEGSLRYFIRGLKVAGLIAVGGVAGAMCCGFLAMILFNVDWLTAFAFGVILSATSVSVTVSALEEMGKLDSREAMLIVEAAVVDDVIGLVLLSFLSAFQQHVNYLWLLSIPFIAFLVWYGTAWFSSKYMDIIYKYIGRIGAIRGIEAFTIAILFILAFVAQELGLASVLLAYAYGIGVATHRYFAKRVKDSVGFIAAIFSPLFFIYVGYRLDIEYLSNIDLLSILYAVIIIVAFGFISKLVGCYLAARAMGLSHKSSLVIGIGMIPRSEVAMIAATISYEINLIGPDLFAAYLVMILATVIISPILLKKVMNIL